MALSSDRPDVFRRFLGHFIDVIIGLLVTALLTPFISGLASVVGSAYLLFRDGLMFALTKEENWRNRSIGKRLVNMEVITMDGGPVDLAVSAKRNAPFALFALAGWMPWFLGVFVWLAAVAITLIEIFLVIADRHGRRLGDQWATTQVVSTI